MSSIEKSSLQHILISYSEYERLKNIEKEFNKLQNNIHEKLQIPNGKNPELATSNSDSNEESEDNLKQSGRGENLNSKRKYSDDTDFIAKVAHLVSQQINPMVSARPVSSAWSNFDLSPPSTSVIGNTNTLPPLHYDIRSFKNKDNDSFGETLKV